MLPTCGVQVAVPLVIDSWLQLLKGFWLGPYSETETETPRIVHIYSSNEGNPPLYDKK